MLTVQICKPIAFYAEAGQVCHTVRSLCWLQLVLFSSAFFKQQPPKEQFPPGSLAGTAVLCNGDHPPAINNIIYLVKQLYLGVTGGQMLVFTLRAEVSWPWQVACPGSPGGRCKHVLLTLSGYSHLGPCQRLQWMESSCSLYSWLSWDCKGARFLRVSVQDE